MDGSNDQKLIETVMDCMQTRFRHTNFKSVEQKRAILQILRGESDVFISLPDGYGRKLCYELPAVMAATMSKKCTIVLTELNISSTKRRVGELQDLGIICSKLDQVFPGANAHRPSAFKIDNDVIEKEPGLIFAPLTLTQLPGIHILINFFIAEGLLAYIVVDEICNKYTFNPNSPNYFANIGKLRSKYSNITWISVTDKIAPDNIGAILHKMQFKVEDPRSAIILAPDYRSNLFLDVEMCDRLAKSHHRLVKFVRDCLKRLRKRTGLVYCENSIMCVEIAKILTSRNIKAGAIYISLSKKTYQTTMEQFREGKIQVLVLTHNILTDVLKSPNLLFIAHWGLPFNLLEYYYETKVPLGSVVKCRIFAERDDTKDEISQKSHDVNPRDQTALKGKRQIMEYCENSDVCRHKMMANYFEDKFSECGDKCDVCLVAIKNRILKMWDQLVIFQKEVEEREKQNIA